MSAILGFDIDGRPLRAGDHIVCTLSGSRGRVTRVEPDADCWHWTDRNCLEFAEDGGGMACVDDQCMRKIHNDHLPAPQTYEQLIQNLKTGETA